MADRHAAASTARSRAPDSAADLALYAAPIGFAAPLILASDANAAQGLAPASVSGWTPATPPAATEGRLPDWSLPEKFGGSSAAPPAALEAKGMANAPGDQPGGEKIVAFHIGSAPPPAAAPSSQVAPVTRSEPDPAEAQAQGEVAAPGAGLAEIEQANALAALQNLAAVSPVPVAGHGAALAATTLGNVLSVLDEVGEVASGAVSALTATVDAPVEATLDLVTGTVGGALAAVGGTVGSLGGNVGETVGGLTSALTATPNDLADDLGTLGGDDPVGGIATLVELVGSDTLFGPAPSPASEFLLSPAAGVADGLIGALGSVADDGDAPSQVLLGLADPNPGPLGLLDQLIDGSN